MRLGDDFRQLAVSGRHFDVSDCLRLLTNGSYAVRNAHPLSSSRRACCSHDAGLFAIMSRLLHLATVGARVARIIAVAVRSVARRHAAQRCWLASGVTTLTASGARPIDWCRRRASVVAARAFAMGAGAVASARERRRRPTTRNLPVGGHTRSRASSPRPDLRSLRVGGSVVEPVTSRSRRARACGRLTRTNEAVATGWEPASAWLSHHRAALRRHRSALRKPQRQRPRSVPSGCPPRRRA